MLHVSQVQIRLVIDASVVYVQAFVSVNWLLSEEPVDLETELAWEFLDYLMLGTSASPLRRALTESGLGERMIGGGLSDELRQPTFSLGLKGVDPADSQKVCLAATHPSSECFLCTSCAPMRVLACSLLIKTKQASSI